MASAAALLLGREPFDAADGETTCWFTAFALFALVLSGWYIAREQGDNPWLSPPSLMMALFCFRYGWGALVAYYWSSIRWEAYPEVRQTFVVGGVWQHLAPACRLSLLGGLGMAIGLTSRGPRLTAILPRLRWAADPEKFKRAVLITGPVLGAAGFLASRIALPKAIIYLSLVVTSLSNGMILLGTYYLFAEPAARKPPWMLYVPLVYILLTWTDLPSGQMAPFLLPLLMMLCGYVLARRSLPWIALAVGVPFLLLVALPFLSYYKAAGVNSPTEVTTVDQRVWAASEAFASSSTDAKLELALARSVARLSGMTFPARFVQYFPRAYPFEHGRTFLIELSGLVPRFLWPDKPEVFPELNRYSELVGLIPRGSTTSAVFDGVSEYYANFGDAGVFLLAIVNGWYLSALYGWLVREGYYVIGSALFLPLLLGNWDLFGVVNIATTHLHVLPVWIIAVYLMSRRTRRAFR